MSEGDVLQLLRIGSFPEQRRNVVQNYLRVGNVRVGMGNIGIDQFLQFRLLFFDKLSLEIEQFGEYVVQGWWETFGLVFACYDGEVEAKDFEDLSD